MVFKKFVGWLKTFKFISDANYKKTVVVIM